MDTAPYFGSVSPRNLQLPGFGNGHVPFTKVSQDIPLKCTMRFDKKEIEILGQYGDVQTGATLRSTNTIKQGANSSFMSGGDKECVRVGEGEVVPISVPQAKDPIFERMEKRRRAFSTGLCRRSRKQGRNDQNCIAGYPNIILPLSGRGVAGSMSNVPLTTNQGPEGQQALFFINDVLLKLPTTKENNLDNQGDGGQQATNLTNQQKEVSNPLNEAPDPKFGSNIKELNLNEEIELLCPSYERDTGGSAGDPVIVKSRRLMRKRPSTFSQISSSGNQVAVRENLIYRDSVSLPICPIREDTAMSIDDKDQKEIEWFNAFQPENNIQSTYPPSTGIQMELNVEDFSCATDRMSQQAALMSPSSVTVPTVPTKINTPRDQKPTLQKKPSSFLTTLSSQQQQQQQPQQQPLYLQHRPPTQKKKVAFYIHNSIKDPQMSVSYETVSKQLKTIASELALKKESGTTSIGVGKVDTWELNVSAMKFIQTIFNCVDSGNSPQLKVIHKILMDTECFTKLKEAISLVCDLTRSLRSRVSKEAATTLLSLYKSISINSQGCEPSVLPLMEEIRSQLKAIGEFKIGNAMSSLLLLSVKSNKFIAAECEVTLSYMFRTSDIKRLAQLIVGNGVTDSLSPGMTNIANVMGMISNCFQQMGFGATNAITGPGSSIHAKKIMLFSLVLERIGPCSSIAEYPINISVAVIYVCGCLSDAAPLCRSGAKRCLCLLKMNVGADVVSSLVKQFFHGRELSMIERVMGECREVQPFTLEDVTLTAKIGVDIFPPSPPLRSESRGSIDIVSKGILPPIKSGRRD